MFTFREYLSESTLLVEAKKVHLSHVEDEILNKGYDGAKAAMSYLDSVASTLAGHSDSQVMVTTKWDGSPALFVGNNPENGKFFVGTKGVFSKKNPRICYSNADVEEHYGDCPGLAKLLKAALNHLPQLGIKDRILQGDVMFGPDNIQTQDIDGEKMVTFHPNTILYAVPAKSKLGKKISDAKFGIIFHTEYEGPSIHELKKSFNICLDDLKKSKDVWYDDASYLDTSGTVTMTADETDEIKEKLDKANRTLHSISKDEFEQLFKIKTFIQTLMQYQNHLIRGGEQITCPGSWMGGLPDFVNMKVDKEKTKTDSKDRKKAKLAGHIEDVKDTLEKVLEFQRLLVEIKQTLINKLENAKSIGTFHVTDKGLEVAKQEGFVAVDHIGDAVKLVDRLDFSKHNWDRRAKVKAEDEEMHVAADGKYIFNDKSEYYNPGEKPQYQDDYNLSYMTTGGTTFDSVGT